MRERFFNEEDYLRLKDSYILTPQKLMTAKKDLAIMHPLPRVNEISIAVDDDPRACYFKQVLYGKYMRMALILKLLYENTDADHSMNTYQIMDALENMGHGRPDRKTMQASLCWKNTSPFS